MMKVLLTKEEEVDTPEQAFVWHASVAVAYAEELLAQDFEPSQGQWRLLAERCLKIKQPMEQFNA